MCVIALLTVACSLQRYLQSYVRYSVTYSCMSITALLTIVCPLQRYLQSYVCYSVIYDRQDWEAAQVPVRRRVDKRVWCVYRVE